MNIVVSTLNAKYIHTCLALRYLKAYSEPDFHVEMAEYTIKDPAINIVSDLYMKSLMYLASAVIYGTSKKP